MRPNKTPWTMPSWMEPYRDLFNNTGGNSIEDLMNDDRTTSRDNAIRMALIFCVRSQIALLTDLHVKRLLRPDRDPGLLAPKDATISAIRKQIQIEQQVISEHSRRLRQEVLS